MSVLLKHVLAMDGIFADRDAVDEIKRKQYRAAAKDGLDITALRQVITIRRKYGANPPAFEKADMTVRRYLTELDELGANSLARACARGPKAKLTRRGRP